jgi:hypothetical protein
VCPSHTSSAEGSDEVTDCVCVAGYTAASDGVACSPCEAGMFKRVVGTAACETCPVNSGSSSGSALCYCLTGFPGIDGGPCDACSDCTSAVTFTATLAMTLTEFSTAKRDAYMNGVAKALSVVPSSVAIALVTEQFTRRRLLASNLLVTTTVTVPQEKASSVAIAATSENLNAALASSDISVGAVSARTVAAVPASSGDQSSTTPGTGGGNKVVIIAVAVAVVLVLGAGVCILVRRRNSTVNSEGGSARVEITVLEPAEADVVQQAPGDRPTLGTRCSNPEQEAPSAPPLMQEHVSECVVCIDAPASMALLPCGHRCVCAGCVARICSCPICRGEVQGSVRIFDI